MFQQLSPFLTRLKKRVKTVSANQTKRQQPAHSVEAVPTGFLEISETQPHDVFIVGYPKSGNTWMQNLVAGLVFGIDTQYLTDKLTQLIVPDIHSAGHYKRLGEPCFFKSHGLPSPEYRRVVYLVRDGRDALVSYYHMLKAVSPTPIRFDDIVHNGVGLFPSRWHEHVQQWQDNPYACELIVIRYEDLLNDPVDQCQRICQFAGLERDVATIERAVAGNDFAVMQMKEKRFGWDNQAWTSSESFIRRGVVGSHKDEMPADLVAEFERQSHQQLRAFGYPLST